MTFGSCLVMGYLLTGQVRAAQVHPERTGTSRAQTLALRAMSRAC